MHALVQQTSLALDDGVFQIGTLLLIALPVLLYVGLIIGALISILGSAQTFGMKVVWIIFVFVAPFLGSILWFVIGRGNARRMA
ncbi:Phospholipase_D-nuclease N-terminal [Saccharopolyspora kobensis]|uniref:Phospholipase_D-nuclease N-terminal n=1 Tax=Saccharopolyspora kobensis TaxID=146035 RepID=A0A1H5ZG12_9PSEU|nr:PLD nuclease N-terminal domain-containing protein [Saccharopolyspora kobensis]SEG34685.1 Phospholipase_D-nuclease N-terminal [Saccharopolyspora kobensis]SFF17585.1 Phospholipase_D-nuclease N-terminal [Saccharopolyspora kobensis]